MQISPIYEHFRVFEVFEANRVHIRAIGTISTGNCIESRPGYNGQGPEAQKP